MSVVVPLALLARLRPDGFDWQVAGLRGELITALLKCLPKAIRRNVVPAADWAAKIAAELPERPEGTGGASRSTAPMTVTAVHGGRRRRDQEARLHPGDRR